MLLPTYCVHCIPSALLQLKVMVPWMHACDHDLSRQLQFSGLYQVRLG